MEEDKPRPADPLSNDGFLAALTARIVAGERIEPGPLCDERPELASAIREICQNAERIAKQLGPDAQESVGDTVRVTPESRSGSFDAFLETLRTRIGPDRYRMRGEIAVGGMGAILRVEDQVLNRPLAMKVILGQGDVAPTGQTPPVDDRTLGRFLDEAQVTAQLDHPGIVPIHELGIDATGRVYFTMKLVKGETLAEVFEKVATGADGWNLPRALGSLLRVAEAMAYAHDKRVLHRDLKPSNVMVGRFGEVFVMDWGLARILGEPDRRDLRFAGNTTGTRVTSPRQTHAEETPDTPLVTMDGDVVGTPAYMPPEQAEGRLEDVGPRSDVYSFGAMLYHLLVGHSPYVNPGARVSARTILAMVVRGPPEPVAQLALSAPPMLVAICEKAMARRPGERYADMKELATDLRAYLEGRVVRAYRTGALAEIVQWTQRNRATAVSTATAFLVITTLAVGFMHEISRHSAELAVQNTNLELVNHALSDMQNSRDAEATEKRWASYVGNIRGANATLTSGSRDISRALLDACPEELRSWEWRYLDTWQDEAIRVLDAFPDNSEYGASVMALAWVPSENALLCGNWNGDIKKLNATTGELLARSNLNGSISQIVPSPDGKNIAVVIGRVVQLLDMRGFELAWRFSSEFDSRSSTSELTDVAFSAEGRFIGIVGTSNMAIFLDREDGTIAGVIATRSDLACSIAFDSARKAVVVGTQNGGIEWFDDRPPFLRRHALASQENSNDIRNLALSSNHGYLVAGAFEHVDVLRANDYEREYSVSIASYSDSLSVGSNRFAIINEDRLANEPGVTLFSFGSSESDGRVWHRTGSDVNSISINADDSVVALGDSDGKISIHDMNRSDPPHNRIRSWDRVMAAWIDISGNLLVLSEFSDSHIGPREFALWNGSRVEWRIRANKQDFEELLAVSSNGSRLALVEGRENVLVIEAASGNVIRTINRPGEFISGVGLDATGENLIVALRDSLDIIDIESGSLKSELEFRRDSDLSFHTKIAISRGASTVVGIDSESDRIIEWNLRDGSFVERVDKNGTHRIAISPNGERLAVVGREIRVFTVPALELLLSIPFDDPFGCKWIGWSADGASLVSVSANNEIAVWRSDRASAFVDARDYGARQTIRSLVESSIASELDWESGPQAIDSKNLDDLNSGVFWQLWRELGRDAARDRAKRSLELSSRVGRSPNEYVEALRLANSASSWFPDETTVRLARCAALFRLDRLDEARIDLQREHFYSSTWYFDGAGRWSIEDTLQSLLSIIEQQFGNKQAALDWLTVNDREPIELHDYTSIATRRFVQEARAACGLPINPEGLPPIPDDHDD